MRPPLAVLAVCALLGSPDRLRAQSDPAEPLVTDRPDFTESAVTIARGRAQLEGGYTFTDDGDVEEHAVGEILLRIGASPRLEVRVGLNSYVWTDGPGGDDSGAEDLSLGIKWALLEAVEGARGRPAAALLLGTSVPTGSDEFGEDEWQPGAVLALAWDLSDRVSLGTNVGVASASENGDRFGQASGSLAVGIGLTDRVGAYVETFGISPTGEDGPDAGFVNGGFTFLFGPDFQLDARAGLGLNDDAADAFFGVGASRRW